MLEKQMCPTMPGSERILYFRTLLEALQTGIKNQINHQRLYHLPPDSLHSACIFICTMFFVVCFVFFISELFSCSPGWPQIFYVAKNNLNLWSFSLHLSSVWVLGMTHTMNKFFKIFFYICKWREGGRRWWWAATHSSLAKVCSLPCPVGVHSRADLWDSLQGGWLTIGSAPG